MTQTKRKTEIIRRSNKESYQGAELESRIINQMKTVEREKEKERQAKREWLKAQVSILDAEDELNDLILIKIKSKS